MTFKQSVLAAVGITVLLVSGTALAAGRMREVGTVTFEPDPFDLQKGTYNLRPEQSRPRALQIEADGGSAEIRSLRLYYVDGDVVRLSVRQSLNDGDQSPVIPIADPRPIKSIEVAYLPKGPVNLILLADSGPAAPPPPQWVELGCKSVGFLADVDTLDVNMPDRFKSLRLRGQGIDIDMQNMVVNYADGSEDTIVVRRTLPAGSQTSAIDLRPPARRIDSIDFTYGSRGVGIVKAKLCVDGLKASPPGGG
jgi:hypothetical protein